jgi:outer membrane immunogenic protein
VHRTSLAAAGLMCIASSIASAADLPVKAPIMPVAAPVYSWTGFYVGGDVGALWTRADAIMVPLPNIAFFGTFPNIGGQDDTGFVAGLHAGYNWQLAPSWVVGIEADWSWTNAKGSFSEPWISIPGHPLAGVRPGTDTSMSMDINWLATIRGRTGYLFTPTTLLYFTGGFAFADVGYSASATNEGATYAASTSSSKTASGYVLGGGLEWAVWSNWSVRAEYLFYRLNTSTSANVLNTGPGVFPPPLGSNFSWSDTDLHTVRFGASYRF